MTLSILILGLKLKMQQILSYVVLFTSVFIAVQHKRGKEIPKKACVPEAVLLVKNKTSFMLVGYFTCKVYINARVNFTVHVYIHQ